MPELSESPMTGEKLLVIARYDARSWSARVLQELDADDPWILTWSDGINVWYEAYEHPWHALGRLAALIAAVEQDVFMIHDPLRDHDEHRAFVDEVERFVSRTVHASSCQPGCDGTDPANHQV